jgi:hypothetical protein
MLMRSPFEVARMGAAACTPLLCRLSAPPFLHPHGSVGLNLPGSSSAVAMWSACRARHSHAVCRWSLQAG